MVDVTREPNLSNNLQCSNCSSKLTSDRIVDSYAMPLTGKSITVSEALQAIFKGYETISTLSLITSDEIKFCNPCGDVFGKLLKLYTQFLELSTLDSIIHNLISEFPHQFVSESKCTSQVPHIVKVDSLTCKPDVEFYSEHEDFKIEVDPLADTNHLKNQLRRSRRVRKPIIPVPDNSSDDFLYSNNPCDREYQESYDSADSDFNESDRNETNNAEEADDKLLKNPLKCEICGDVFQQRWRMKMHKEAEHEGIREFRCRLCDWSYESLSCLQRHEYKKHRIRRGKPRHDNRKLITEEDRPLLDYKEYKCDTEGCEAVSLSSFKDWILHQQEIHKIDTNYKDIDKKKTLRPKDKLIRPCPTCGKKVKSNFEVIRHTKTNHLNLRPFECSICKKAFVAVNYLNLHIEKVHAQESKYLCNLCGTTFKTEGGMRLHEQTHYGRERPLKFECEICQKKFPIKSLLKKHMDSVHSDEEPYQCDQCGKKYKVEQYLNRHKEWQHVLRVNLPQSCEFCKKGFPAKDKLKLHLMSRHKLSLEAAKISAKIKQKNLFRILPNGDRVYKESKPVKSKTCEICGRTYARLEFLYTHLVKAHGKTEEEAKDITKLETTRTLITDGITSSSSTRKRKASTTATADSSTSEVYHQNSERQQQYGYNLNFHPSTLFGYNRN